MSLICGLKLLHQHLQRGPGDVVSFARILYQNGAVILTRTPVVPRVLLVMDEKLSTLSEPPKLSDRPFDCVHFLSQQALPEPINLANDLSFLVSPNCLMGAGVTSISSSGLYCLAHRGQRP